MADIIVPISQHADKRLKDMGDGTYAEVVYASGASISVGDVELGAVEIKNDSDDTRAKVGGGTASNALRVVSATDDPLVTRLGEVQASPTANTVLDRLRALLTGIVLSAGSAIIGKVGLDQTTPGTTNAVAPISGQAGVAGGTGAASATTQRVTVATDDGLHTKIGEVQASPTANTILDRLKALLTGIVLSTGSNIIGRVGLDQTTPGTTNAVAVITGQNGVAGGSGATGATTQRVVHATDDPAVATLGATTGAAVITDANGTVQQYLRGLVKQWVAGTLVLGAGSNLIGKVQEPSISGAASVAPSDSVTVTAGRQLLINCTVAGNVKVGFTDASTLTVPVGVGLNIFPWAVTQVFVTGTTATATYTNLL